MHKKSIEIAKNLLFEGELVIFPTETVYGIGADATNHEAIKLIYKTKKRPVTNPLICHFKNIEDIKKNFVLKDKDFELAKAYMPGPLTLILERKKDSHIAPYVSNNKNLVGCRIPNNDIALKLLSELYFPIAAPSANLAKRTSATSIKNLDSSLRNIFQIDGGASVLGLESTVIQTTNNGCKILRLGSLTIEEIKKKFPYYFIEIESSKISPGNQFKHYSPRKPIRINVNHVNENEALLSYGKNKLVSNIINMNLSIDEDLVEASRNFYNYLNILDLSDCHSIAVVPIPNKDLGKTINDRLKRASYIDE